MAGMLRVSEEVELMGMDVAEQGGPAYRRSSVFESTYSAELGKLIKSDVNTKIKEKTNDGECIQSDAPIMEGDEDEVHRESPPRMATKASSRRLSLTLRDGAQ